jgi:hypothetical protein
MKNDEDAITFLYREEKKFNINESSALVGGYLISVGYSDETLCLGIMTDKLISIMFIVENVEAFRVSRFGSNEVIKSITFQPLGMISSKTYQEISLFGDTMTSERQSYKDKQAQLGANFLTIKFGNSGYLHGLILPESSN